MQTVNEPYLPCFDQTGARNVYPTLTDGDQDRTPAISMSWLFTVNAATTYPFSFQIRAKYEFRGRVLTDEPGLVDYLRITREAKAS